MKNATLFILALFLVLLSVFASVMANPASQLAISPSNAGAKELVLDLGNKVTMKLVLIPAGKFSMGSPASETRYDISAELAHDVTISKPFFMGTTHVTVDQFAAFAKDSGYQSEAEKDGTSSVGLAQGGKIVYDNKKGACWRNPGFPQTGDHPAVHISWNDANAFCQWLGKKSGKNVLLPTEAQWEYACRAGTKTAFPWGDDPNGGKGWANCEDLSLKNAASGSIGAWAYSWDDGFIYTSPVASFRANAFGLYDMIGNACQWCADFYGDYNKTANVDPVGPASGKERVLRGGSWFSDPKSSRSAYRYPLTNGHSDHLGFRVVVKNAE